MKLPEIKVFADLPRNVAISVVVIVMCVVLFGVLYPTLGGAQSQAHEDNARLSNENNQSTGKIQQLRGDRDFVLAHKDEFEELLAGDRLVAHARRAAVRQLQTLYTQRALSNMSYTFAAADAASTGARPGAPPTVGEYRVSAENVELRIGAQVDTSVFEFLLDLADNFPGAAVLQSFSLDRAPIITDELLDKVSATQDSGLVKGEIKFIWRTAQANEEKKAPGK